MDSDIGAPARKSPPPPETKPQRAHRCCLLVSLGTDDSAAFPPRSLDGVLSKYKAGTPISQEAWENPLPPLLKLA